ncbi:hypothetical protein ACB092_11G106700 [Castanea dentata]
MQVLLGLYMVLFPGALLLAITTCQQTRRHFFWSFLISLSGQMFIFKIMPGLLCHYFGVASRWVIKKCQRVGSINKVIIERRLLRNWKSSPSFMTVEYGYK